MQRYINERQTCHSIVKQRHVISNGKNKDNDELIRKLLCFFYNHGKNSWHTLCNLYNYPYIYHKNRKWGMTLLKKKAGVLAFIIIPSPPPSVNVGDLALAFDNMNSDQHWIGRTGVTFLLNQVKRANIFSMIVATLHRPIFYTTNRTIRYINKRESKKKSFRRKRDDIMPREGGKEHEKGRVVKAQKCDNPICAFKSVKNQIKHKTNKMSLRKQKLHANAELWQLF